MLRYRSFERSFKFLPYNQSGTAMNSVRPQNQAKYLLLILLLCAFGAHAQDQVFSDNDGAIRGYDPVAYFTEGKPVKGDSAITSEYNGATWHFSSAANRDLFIGNPDKYAPAYGGYCAFGLSKGHLVQTDPSAWTIHDDKLYLNFSKAVRNTWQNDIPGNVQLSDSNWKKQGF